MPDVLYQPWWTWTPETASAWDHGYRYFNLFEAGAWFVFGLLVLHRWHKHRHSRSEIFYAAAFLAFGLTDVAEGWRQSFPLVAIKGAILAVLLILRANIRKRWYPASRLY